MIVVRRRYALLTVIGLLLIALTIVTHFMQACAIRGDGLRVAYRVGPRASPPRSVRSLRESVPSTPTLRRDIPAYLRGPFRATWRGTMLVDEPGSYELAAHADGVLKLWLRNRLILHSVTGVPPTTRTAKVELDRGPHEIRVDYVHARGPVTLHLAYRAPGDAFRSFPRVAGRFVGRPISVGQYWGSRVARLLSWVTVGAWLAAALGLGIALWRAWMRAVLRREEQSLRLPASARNALLLAFAMAVWGVEWGLPGFWPWAPDEITAARLFEALDSRFVGGWHDLYPPLQFYLLAPLGAVVRAGQGLGWYDAYTLVPVTLLQLGMRLASVFMALGCLLFIYLTAREVGNDRRAVYAVLLSALSLSFLYYAKTANVDIPYLFWVASSLWFYVRFLQRGERRDALWLAVTAAAAVCTKDQAYGFYVLMPIPLAAATIARRRARGERSVWKAVLDPTFGLATAVALFGMAAIYLLPLNLPGFLSHLEELQRGTYPPLVEGSAAGHLQLLRLSIALLVWSAGWPAFLLCTAGVMLAIVPNWIRMPREARGVQTGGWLRGHLRANWKLLALLVPAVSYYLTFIGYVQYVYDRFLLGVWLILAIFGGYFIERAFAWAGERGIAVRGLVAASLAYTLLHASTVNASMGLDARYAAQRFLEARTPAFGTVCLVAGEAMERYLPHAHAFRLFHFNPTRRSGEFGRPHLVVLNERERLRWSRAGVARRFFEDLEGGATGYRRVFGGPTPLPAWAFALRPRIAGLDEAWSLDHLDKVNPPISIYARDDLAARWSGMAQYRK